MSRPAKVGLAVVAVGTLVLVLLALSDDDALAPIAALFLLGCGAAVMVFIALVDTAIEVWEKRHSIF